MFTVVIGQDGAGEFQLLLRQEDELSGGDVRWRHVGQSQDYGEAVRLAQAAHEECYGIKPKADPKIALSGFDPGIGDAANGHNRAPRRGARVRKSLRWVGGGGRSRTGE